MPKTPSEGLGPSREIKALVPYFGCKRSSAEAIIQQLGPHRSYWEPFCGSAAVLLCKAAVQRETVNDLHRGLINLARVVQDDVKAVCLYDKLTRTLASEALYEDSCNICADYDIRNPDGPAHLDWAYHYLVSSWLSRNGFAGSAEPPAGFCVRYTSNGGDPAVRFRTVIGSLPGWWRRLRQVTVLNKDGLAICAKIEDKEGTVIYVDPPYLVKTAPYLHDFSTADHQRLARLLGRFKRTRVVVSYYEHLMLAKLYPEDRWRKLNLAIRKQLSSRERGEQATELLLINGAILD
jgi:DNA adenine methylase